MKKLQFKPLLIFLTFVLLFSTSISVLNSGGKVFAANADSYNLEDIYNQGTSEGVIDEYTDFADWKIENEEIYIPNYEEAQAEGILGQIYGNNNITYAEWLKLNNYGVMSNDGIDPADVTEEWDYEEYEANKNSKIAYKGFNLQKGDILITNSTSSFGVTGHTAIMNGPNHVLDMPGKKSGTKNNNRQLSVAEWMGNYLKKKGDYVRVYRINNSSLAAQVGTYADRNYWSTVGASTKNIQIDYKIGSLYTTNPKTHGLYCSQLVYLAYYYGSGSLPVMMGYASSMLVSPYSMPSYFTNSYKPTLVKQYNF